VSRTAPLRHAAFRRLAGAYAISRIGDVLAIVAMAIVVWDRTHSTFATTALFVALEFLPALAGPPLVARFDRLPVRRVLTTVYVLEAAVFAVLALLTREFSLGPFLLLVAVDGALGIVARSLCRGAIAAVLEPTGDLRAGNALLNLAVAPNMAIGGAVGGVLVATAGADVALLVNAATFALGALMIRTAPGLPRDVPGEDDEPHERWQERLSATLTYVRRRRLVLALFVGQALALIFFAMTEPIEVAYTRESLDAGPGAYGAFIATWGAGAVLGSALYTWVGSTRLAFVTAASTAILGAAYLALAVATSIEAACAIAVIGGAASSAQLVAITTAIQESIELGQQARVMSVFESVGMAAPGLGYVIGGVVAAGAGGRAAFAVAGCGVLVVLAAVLAARPWRARGARAPEYAEA
jgi:predicted MFS family arabinose efflux permease